MKINRRNAIMATIGSIFGGKDAAKSVLTQGSGEAILKGGYLGDKISGTGIREAMTESLSREDHIKICKNTIERLKKLLNGELHGWQKERMNDFNEMILRKQMLEIDNFKSISVFAKISMIDRLQKKRMYDHWTKEAREELDFYTDALENLEKNISTLGGLIQENDPNISKEYYRQMGNKSSRG